jgi:hypothetical protein
LDKKYQIFVSSTFQDLEEERRKVIEQILNLGHIPVGMELFQAGDETQWVYIQKRIVECDYYLVIVAERYGSEGNDGQSYTEMEYRFACNSKIPVAAFLLNEDSRRLWPQEKVEYEKREKLNKFRELCSTRMCKFWQNGDDLGSKVVTSLWGLFESNPRVGWVRGDSVASNEAVDEIASLSKERRSLQEELEKIKKELSSVNFNNEYQARVSKLGLISSSDQLEMSSATRCENDISIMELLYYTYQRLSLGVNVSDANAIISGTLRTATDHGPRNVDSQNILSLLAANDLIDVRFSQQTALDGRLYTDKIYILSDYGKKIAAYYEDQMHTQE